MGSKMVWKVRYLYFFSSLVGLIQEEEDEVADLLTSADDRSSKQGRPTNPLGKVRGQGESDRGKKQVLFDIDLPP